MRTIGIVTGARSDYGLYLPLLKKIQSDPDLQLKLIVTGMHLSPEFGRTVDIISQDGFKIDAHVEMLLSSDTPESISKSMGLGTIGFAQLFGRDRPDLLVVLGDRFEMHAAALAALPFKIPIAHIHGGEVTEGAIDEALRHSLTKLSHLHFVATEEYGLRVIQMGEEPWRVTVSGAPGLDDLFSVKKMTWNELKAKLRLPFERLPLLVTFHPVTLEAEQTEWHIKELLAALERAGLPVIFTQSNADTGGRIITVLMEDYCRTHPETKMIQNLGTETYGSFMAIIPAMVGNSSSGLIEAPSFELPVVNIGRRQEGRLRTNNVIDVGFGRDEIVAGIRKALDPKFREGLRGLVNPYGVGHASERILQRLKEIPLDNHLMIKRFRDLP